MSIDNYNDLLNILPRIRKKPNYVFATQMYLISHNFLPKGLFYNEARNCYSKENCREDRSEFVKIFKLYPSIMNGCLENNECNNNIVNFIQENNINLIINKKSISLINSNSNSYFYFDNKEFFDINLINTRCYSNLLPTSTYNSDTYIIEGKYFQKSKPVYIGTFKFKKVLDPTLFISKIQDALELLGYQNVKIEKLELKMKRMRQEYLY
jgi:hypothetical protein